MGICSYLLVGHHSERAAARAAAVKAFLVTRVGDLGVLLAVVIAARRRADDVDPRPDRAGTELLPRRHGHRRVALLLLAGVAGKSAQFPLHTWLPDAMEGPTPVSALIHAATMVAAGVYLVARLLPLFLAADGALAVAAVIASITMLGAALAALAQDDLKRLLAWSTVSQVAYMLAGVSVAPRPRPDGGRRPPGLPPPLARGVQGAAVPGRRLRRPTSSARPCSSDMGGLRRTPPRRSPCCSGSGSRRWPASRRSAGFWSKEAVLTAAEYAASARVGWPAQMVLASGLLTTLVTGVYAGRASRSSRWRSARRRPPCPRPADAGAGPPRGGRGRGTTRRPPAGDAGRRAEATAARAAAPRWSGRCGCSPCRRCCSGWCSSARPRCSARSTSTS